MNTDVKQLIKTAKLSNVPQLSHVDKSLLAELEVLQADFLRENKHLKELLKDKKATSALFGKHRDNPETLLTLKQTMQSISARVKQVEAELKAIQEAFRQRLETMTSRPSPSLPEHLTGPTLTFDQPVQFEWCTPDDGRWADYCAQNEAYTSSAHCLGILTAISEAFHYRSRILLATHAGRVVGGLPLTFINSAIFGKSAVSTPYFNYGGPVSSYIDVCEALIRECKNLPLLDSSAQVEIRTTLGGFAFRSSEKKVSMIKELPDTVKALNEQLGTKVRAQINRALPHEPDIKFGKDELLDDFYQVFARNMRDLGTPVYSSKWFQTLLNQPDLNCTLVVCYLNQHPVATGFLMQHRNMMEIPWASTLKEVNAKNINMWMYHQILSHTIRNCSCRFFDFGRSTINAGTYRFKKQWGAVPVQHHWYYPNDALDISETNPDNPKFRALIAIWKRLPVWLTRIIGPPIVKQIP